MKNNIFQNIRRLRKEKSLRQEQLAEALGVSVGAVSKWERGAATPDLDYILEMANLFGVSVDMLVGYDIQDNTADSMIQRIQDLIISKDYQQGKREIENALQRYPNDFRIVYQCAVFCRLMGFETEDEQNLKKAIRLYERALLLYSQNIDSEISEVTIRNNIADCCLMLGEAEKAIELMKKNNICGINNALIGNAYASHLHKPAEAIPYLADSMGNSFQNIVKTMSGFADAYSAMGKDRETMDSLLWLISYLDSLSAEEGPVTYLDKMKALFYSRCAVLAEKNGREAAAREYLKKAYDYAAAFDAAPDHGMTGVKFIDGTKAAAAYDNIGIAVMDAVEKNISGSAWTASLKACWEEWKYGKEK